ncbi:MAG TPA: hypothetical protein VOA88_05115 [Candidatus Dormibacteraeota bacterium]|nr:hypothetical protein [Candidatus Dormibacteraeota bacterium]
MRVAIDIEQIADFVDLVPLSSEEWRAVARELGNLRCKVCGAREPLEIFWSESNGLLNPMPLLDAVCPTHCEPGLLKAVPQI